MRRTALIFPAEEIKRRLRIELEKIVGESAPLQSKWEPLLDSQRVIGTVLVLVDLLPGCEIPPDMVIRKGGCNSVDEAIDDIPDRARQIVANCNQV